MKTAVIFPGVGYHSDKPLLYYSKKAAAAAGFSVKEVVYHDLPQVIRNDKASMTAACEAALIQAEEQIADALSESSEILFISKSMGTVVAGEYALKHGFTGVNHLCFTPVKDTFARLSGGTGLIFHGLSDPWCESSIVYEEYRKLMKDYKLCTYENANHSIETGNPVMDIKLMQHIVNTVCRYISTQTDSD